MLPIDIPPITIAWIKNASRNHRSRWLCENVATSESGESRSIRVSAGVDSAWALMGLVLTT